MTGGTANSTPVSTGPDQPLAFRTPAQIRALNATPYRTDAWCVDDPQFGVIGDGVADDTLALRAAIASGRNLYCTPGRIYVISGGLTILAGQSFNGQSATIKRATQVSTTTLTSIVAGVTNQITVASTAGFRVGMDINIVNGSIFDRNGNRTVSAINGNVITTSTTWSISASGTSTVYSSLTMFNVGQDATLNDIVLDGNRSNVSWSRWEVTGAVHLYRRNSAANRVRVREEAGEGFVIYADFASVSRCLAENLGGNGVHFTGCNWPRVVNTDIINPNLDLSVGHSMGCIGWSDQISGALVDGCNLRGGLTGLGQIDSYDNSDVTVNNTEIRDSIGDGVSCAAGTANNSPCRLIFDNLRVYNSGGYCVRIQQTQASTQVPSWVVLKGCYLESNASNDTVGGCVSLGQIENLSFSGNILQAMNAQKTLLQMSGVTASTISGGNVFRGGKYAIVVTSGLRASHTIAIVGNSFDRQIFGVLNSDNTVGNSLFSSNAIVNDSSADSTWDGLTLGIGWTASGNTISAVKGRYGIRTSFVLGSTFSGAVVAGNTISGTLTASIRTENGSGGTITNGNTFSSTAPLSFGGGTVGTPAVATYTGAIVGGVLTTGAGQVTVSNGGSGYSGTVNAWFTGGGGSGAYGTATLSGGVITAVSVSYGGTGYTSAPAVVFSGHYSINNIARQ